MSATVAELLISSNYFDKPQRLLNLDDFNKNLLKDFSLTQVAIAKRLGHFAESFWPLKMFLCIELRL